MPSESPRLLLVDDDRNFRKVTTLALVGDGYDVQEAANGKEALEVLASNRVDVVLCDLKMPVMDGMAFLRELGDDLDELPVVVVTAYGSIDSAVEAMRAGAFDYVTKPVNRDALRLAIDKALRMRSLRRENRLLRERVEGGRAVDQLLGASPAMQELRRTLTRLAESDVPVLIRGESGVGKELAARALHYDGPRSTGGSFVVLNCAAVPGELLESLLFGHRKGAFTGADSAHEGKFESADGGTLFLDEIGDMPLALQAKLLRVLQEGEVERLGENRTRRVDVRVVAATNQDLERQVRRSERLAALGKLVTGLAHEIRNPLGSIKTAVEILSERTPAPDGDAGELYKVILEETDRLNRTLTAFLDFARNEQHAEGQEPRRASLVDGVQATVELVRAEAERRDISVTWDPRRFDAELGITHAHLRQVLLNLVLNAMEAIENDGEIGIHADDSGPEAVVLTVEDDGPGLPAHVGDRIFDPFVSTKERGTGLGLSVVVRLLDSYGGSVDVAPGPSGGACFVVTLPKVGGA